MATPKRSGLDWSKLSSLKLRARFVAEGYYAGAHRSRRRGSGVEFGGHRQYTRGDDLRWLDRHSLMRHGKLLIREFETDTEQALWLVLDASRSMAFRGNAEVPTKFDYGSVVAAALARVAVASGDLVALSWLGERAQGLPPGGGTESFDRIVTALESARPTADLCEDPANVARALGLVARRARRGSVIVVLSDLLDLPSETLDLVLSLTAGQRTLTVVRVLDPAEVHFPYTGALELVASEGDLRLETDASASRAGYLDELARSGRSWRHALVSRGAGYVETSTAHDPAELVRTILNAGEGAA